MCKNTISSINIATKKIVLFSFCSQCILLIKFWRYTWMLTGSQGYLKTSLGHCTSMYAAISPEYTYTNKLIVFNATFVLLVKGTCFIMCSVMADRMWTLFYPNGEKAVHYSKAIRKVFDIRFVSIIVYRKMFLWRQCPERRGAVWQGTCISSDTERQSSAMK